MPAYFKIRTLALSLATVVLSLVVGCQSASNAGKSESIPKDENTLRIGITANMPPFVFEQNGELLGMEIDFARALGQELALEPRFVRMNWERLIPALQRGEIDIIMAGMNYTPERAAVIFLSNPYVRSGQRAMVLRKNASKYTFPGQIANANVRMGAERGTTGEFLVESRFPNATLRTYSSAEEGAKAVINERIELFIHDAPTVLWMAGTYQNEGLTVALPVLTEDLMVWGVSRQSPALLSAVNTALRKWAQDGTTNAILNRWVN
ncbi:MAG: transporter substrate-binding domain-containing protein [Verrucomicrobiota bacterium]